MPSTQIKPPPEQQPPEPPAPPEEAAAAPDEGDGDIGYLQPDEAPEGAVDEEYEPELPPPFDPTDIDDAMIEQLISEFGVEQVVDWLEQLQSTPNIGLPNDDFNYSLEPQEDEEDNSLPMR